ncbi:MAG: 3-phosphoserine/phosphohydroxythreonine transaminase [Myxococcales bacterium]|nr:3-phosphoserine/phosphohydroxythreonine transaminase [Myxococcales bacterium]
MTRIFNFSSGPAILPESVLIEAQQAIWDLNGSGLGLLECSHRSSLFESVLYSAADRLTRLLQLDSDQAVLFLQGGASAQFFLVPMNFLRGGRATYLDTGVWSTKAIAEARRFGTVDVPFSSAQSQFDHVPKPGEWGDLPAQTAYLHYTSNNTVYGTQYDYIPDSKGVPLVGDLSSDILSKPIDGSRFHLIYAGAQKNLGPSGVVVVVVRRSWLDKADKNIPSLLQYQNQVDNDSMVNTPPTFGIYVIDRMCAWIEAQGGLSVVAAKNQAKAAKLYGAIDATDFWRGTVQPSSRSLMNICFRSPSPNLDAEFIRFAESRGLSGLKGHRSVGGMRAGMYNGQTEAAVDALVSLLSEFEKTHG